jgi:hypothetical protein
LDQLDGPEGRRCERGLEAEAATRREIVCYASRQLVQTLLEHDLVGEVRLVVYPVVLGSGQRLFAETNDKTSLRRLEGRTVGTAWPTSGTRSSEPPNARRGTKAGGRSPASLEIASTDDPRARTAGERTGEQDTKLPQIKVFARVLKAAGRPKRPVFESHPRLPYACDPERKAPTADASSRDPRGETERTVVRLRPR